MFGAIMEILRHNNFFYIEHDFINIINNL